MVPTAAPLLGVELCGSEGGPPDSVNAVVTVNVVELLTYLEGPHIYASRCLLHH
jgi:hypothetical protein